MLGNNQICENLVAIRGVTKNHIETSTQSMPLILISLKAFFIHEKIIF